MIRSFPLGIAALFAVSSAYTTSALAKEGWEIEEVIVTAQKREQASNDVPVAVTAFTGDNIRDQSLNVAAELEMQTPGLTTGQGQTGGVPIFTLRGAGLDDYNFNNAGAVGVYVDQVYLASPAYLNSQMLDIAQIEVVKGPQGTLYGRNTTGGAITFVSNKPTEELEASISAKYGRFNRVEIEAFVSGPLTEELSGRLAISNIYHGEGWQKDVDTGEEYGKDKKTAFRAQLQFVPNDRLDILWDIHGSEDRSISATAIENQGVAGRPIDLRLDGRKVSSNLKPERDENGFGTALTINYEFDFATFTSVTAYDDYEVDTLDNLDGAGSWYADLDNNGIEMDQISQEFRLTSNSDGDFSWIVGFNISSETNKGAPRFIIPDAIFDYRSVSFGGSGIGTLDANVEHNYDQEMRAFGVFAHTETQLNEKWRLTAGLRYSVDEVKFDSELRDSTNLDLGFMTELFTSGDLFSAIGAFSGVPSGIAATPLLVAGELVPTGGLVDGIDDEEHDEESLTGKLALDYTPTDDLLFYASLSTGYRGGRYFANGEPSSGYLFYIEPETMTAYEVGFKATLLDGTLQLNGAGFYYDYEDRQSSVYANSAQGLANVPESEMDGAELELQWRPLPGLDIKAGIAYLNTKVIEGLSDTDGDGVENLSPTLNLDSPIEGAELSVSPEWSYNLAVGYEFDLTNTLMARSVVTYSWIDSTVVFLADETAVLPNRSDLGARFAIGANDGTWEVSLWGKNLTDEDNPVYQYGNFASNQYSLRREPATYGIAFSYHYR